MKKKITIFLIPTILLMCSDINYLTVPEQFLDAKIFLGIKFDEIESIRNLKMSNSINAYYEDLENSVYFDRVYYKFTNEILTEISFYKEVDKWNYETDSLSKEIFAICKQKYGMDFEIKGYKIGAKELCMPLITWNCSNHGYVNLSYIPLACYDKIKNNYSFIPTNISFVVTRKQSMEFLETDKFKDYFK